MDNKADFESFNSAEHLDTVRSSVDFYLNQLRLQDTGRASREEYISELNDIFFHYEVSLLVDEREDVKLAEMMGRGVNDLIIAGMNNVTPAHRGDLVFIGQDSRFYSLPVPSLPENFKVGQVTPKDTALKITRRS